MPIEITIPRVGWSMEEGNFAGWLKQNGEQVSAGDALFSVESEKVTLDVESLDAGILYLPRDTPEIGAVVCVGQRIGFLLAPGEAEPESSFKAPVAVASPTPSLRESLPVPDGEARNLITPRARRIASEFGVDPALVSGSGRGGRIREADLRAALDKRSGGAKSIPVGTLRRTIAKRMMDSLRNTAPVTLTSRADATALVGLRNQWKLASAPGDAPTYTDIIAKLVAIALESHPVMGGRWENDCIALQAQANIGIAVDTSKGLLVVVLRDVGTIGLDNLAYRSRELIEAARNARSRREDLSGSNFTITNLGGFGVDAFTPTINFPETAVLGLGAIRKEPVVLLTGEIAVQERITLSLSFDHRVVDGAPAARFLQEIVSLIEVPPELCRP